MNCVRCGHTVGWVECPTGGWWSHEVHPNDNHDAEIRCVHSMVKWDCLSCLQGHIRRGEAENQRLRTVLEDYLSPDLFRRLSIEYGWPHEPNNPLGIWCCKAHRTAFHNRSKP